ncbi:ribosome-associated protein [Keratinibaculum paraultunense]|uniref:Ribosomal silencing factor RsfS n=1 Tax=Keratinibaculum paraultunense TaxID=1278232 RepID=A0A4R3KYQ7_9FIRM|nr:ribosome silencing factor [Keratinibaculum paraultunense]QQY80438.1 ribosome silencing factor [Keratinibaculum paraultunense]TCS91156.1 ribosome-associated protein [Keratinibaculum paraultunense]
MKDIDKRVSIITKACYDKKGFNVKVLNLKKITPMADYFIIASGNSTIQTVAIADEVEEKMETSGYPLLGKEGYQTGRWILLDFGDIVVHVFHKEDREYYNLEKLWADGEEIELD